MLCTAQVCSFDNSPFLPFLNHSQVFRSTIIPLAQSAGLFDEIFLEPHFDLEGKLERSEIEWRSWSCREARRRVAFTFVAMDVAFSAIFLNAPCINIDSINCIFPESDLSFQAPKVDEWQASRNGTTLTLPLCLAVERLLLGTDDILSECLASLLGRTSLLSSIFSSIIRLRHSIPDFDDEESPEHQQFLRFKVGLVRCWRLLNLSLSPATGVRRLRIMWHWACLHLLVRGNF
jgi:hypothetical protein